MTRNEAKEMLQVVKVLLPIRPYTDMAAEALDMAIEALERKRGEWVLNDRQIYECKDCGFVPTFDQYTYDNYCPVCGAVMREGK